MSRAPDDALEAEREEQALAPAPRPPAETPDTERRDSVGFERLRALVQRGYAIDPGPSGPGDGLLLHHPAAAPLLLMPDGTIESLDRGRAAGLRAQTIGAATEADQRLFANFLERLGPGRGGRPRRWRKRLFVGVLILAVWFLSIMLTVMIGNM